MTESELRDLLDVPGERRDLEFKEARNQFDSRQLGRYCAAIANEGGGKLILGVTDKRPRRAVGTKAFENPAKAEQSVSSRLRYVRVRVTGMQLDGRRVVVVDIPSAPPGMLIEFDGEFLVRSGGELRAMSFAELRSVLMKEQPDFSSTICREASLSDLDPVAIAHYRNAWARKADRPEIARLDDSRVLEDSELVIDGEITYAALVLFAAHRAMGRLLPQAEVVHEFRQNETASAYDVRKEFRQGFFSFSDDLWQAIDSHNSVRQYREGLFVWDIPTFNERVVREAILNAVCHRDYRSQAPVFVRQYPEHLRVDSPGGLPDGVTTETILDRHVPRNRRITESMARCGLVERSNQGMRLMFGESVREGKRTPDFAGTDDHQVCVTLSGEIRDASLLRYLEKVSAERNRIFDPIELIVLERVKAGRQVRHTWRREHGCSLSELRQVLNDASPNVVQGLLRELKQEGRVRLEGRTRSAKWFPA